MGGCFGDLPPADYFARFTREVLGKLGVFLLFGLLSGLISTLLSPYEISSRIGLNSYIMKNSKNNKTLRKAVNEAWAAVGKDQLDHPKDSMAARCEGVIAANGGYTKFYVVDISRTSIQI